MTRHGVRHLAKRVKVALREPDIDELFARMDKNRDMVIDREEFKRVMSEEVRNESDQLSRRKALDWNVSNMNAVLTLVLDTWQMMAISFEDGVPWDQVPTCALMIYYHIWT